MPNKPIFKASRFVWLALVITVGIVVTIYLALSLSVSADPLLMPLDDTYIHFQYARQMAHGEPMVYNPGDPATSGGTSFLYPPLLALGYTLGFDGWSLAYWALGIGVLGFVGAAWLVYRITQDNPLTENHSTNALWIALAFALSGPFIWAALSGMETSLFIFTILLTFYAIQHNKLRLAALAAVLMVLARPEGLILAGLGMLALAARFSWQDKQRIKQGLWLVLPLLAGFIQPMINLLATGELSSSGMVAKSHLYNTGAPLAERLQNVIEFFGRMWGELLRGSSPDFGLYTSPLLVVIALGGVVVGLRLAWQQRRVNMAVLALVWILALTVAVSTLDTAFWQFKRYQLPVMALFFPLAGWFISWLSLKGWLRGILLALIFIPSLYTTITFAGNYADNVAVVRDQQVPMARWVSEHIPEEARIGVHDVGLLRYFGDRKLYDVVGLTTRGPASSWRQGPGAIYEHMAHSEYRPDYFAIYPDVQGLRYLLDAGVFREVMAEFPVTLPPHNVAAATGYQAVYGADWSNSHEKEQIAQTTTLAYVDGLALVDQVDVANLESEAEHNYRWWSDEPPPGFVSEVYRNAYLACGRDECRLTDGGRVITGGEEFAVETHHGEDLLLVTRVHGRTSVPLMIYVNGQQVAQRVQPAVPGQWIEVVTFVPGDQVSGEETIIRIEPHPGSDAYMPYYHWVYQGHFIPIAEPEQTPAAIFGETVRLVDYAVSQEPGQIEVVLHWSGHAAGDGIVFVHLYDDINSPPVAQVVSRPMGGVLPPANWLPGLLEDVYTLTLPDDLPPGMYSLAIGLFDARSGQRYPVSGEGANIDRLFIDEITIEE